MTTEHFWLYSASSLASNGLIVLSLVLSFLFPANILAGALKLLTGVLAWSAAVYFGFLIPYQAQKNIVVDLALAGHGAFFPGLNTLILWNARYPSSDSSSERERTDVVIVALFGSMLYLPPQVGILAGIIAAGICWIELKALHIKQESS